MVDFVMVRVINNGAKSNPPRVKRLQGYTRAYANPAGVKRLRG